MRVEPVIAVTATDSVGPTRLRLLTAGSAKLPVVVMADLRGAPAYHVFDEPTEQDMTCGGTAKQVAEPGSKRGLWKRVTGQTD